MDDKEIKIAIKNKELAIDKIIDILLLNDESVITIWISIRKNKNLYFASLSNPNYKDSYILELRKYKNINRLKKFIPHSSFLAAKSFMEAYYLILNKKQ